MANRLQFFQESAVLCRINAGQIVGAVFLDEAADFFCESLVSLVGSDFANIFQC